MTVHPLGLLALLGSLAALPTADAETTPAPVRTLGRVFAKLKAGEPTTIAYFGGSITAAPGYRVQVTKWFRDTFPGARVREIDAAIGGTGSDLGAFRCGLDVVAHDPDLVFVEFNINDGSPVDDFHKATMEGIVRQLWSSRSRPEVVFLYTTSRSLKERRGSHPAVAAHYGLPQIDLQPPLVEALKSPDLPKPTPAQRNDKNLDWSQPGQVFMSDSVHPNALGHAIYTEAIVAYLKTQVDAQPLPPPVLPPPLVTDEFARTRLVAPAKATLSGDWEVTPPVDRGRYRAGTINARQPGNALEYAFEGTAVAFFLDVQKDGGKFTWTIDDGKDVPASPRGDSYLGQTHGVIDTAPGPWFPRNHYAILTHGLPPGRHVLRLKVLPEKDRTSAGHRLLIGYIMLGGVPE
jgi:lysophospholipase L1-like esterase